MSKSYPNQNEQGGAGKVNSTPKKRRSISTFGILAIIAVVITVIILVLT